MKAKSTGRCTACGGSGEYKGRGVVENGIFSSRKADIILLATDSGIEEIKD